MSLTLPDFPPMIARLQTQTLFVDFGRRLPAAVTLSGTPVVAISVADGSKAQDSSPAARLIEGPTIGTAPAVLRGTGLTSTAIFFQLANLEPDVKYLLTYECGRSDGTDTVAGFNHIFGVAPR